MACFHALDTDRRRSLLDFARFLKAGHTATPSVATIPSMVPIPRPAQESVIQAIKRLKQTYPGLEKAKMLPETSALMAEHVLQGRSAVEVIDDLEALFARHYRQQGGHASPPDTASDPL